MKVNLLQGTCTPTLTPMPGVHNTLERDARYARAPQGAALAIMKWGFATTHEKGEVEE
jgi:hypothetical protein